jgi:hypothetical protein
MKLLKIFCLFTALPLGLALHAQAPGIRGGGTGATTAAQALANLSIRASVTSAITVPVYVCGTGTPVSLAYNIVLL